MAPQHDIFIEIDLEMKASARLADRLAEKNRAFLILQKGETRGVYIRTNDSADRTITSELNDTIGDVMMIFAEMGVREKGMSMMAVVGGKGLWDPEKIMKRLSEGDNTQEQLQIWGSEDLTRGSRGKEM